MALKQCEDASTMNAGMPVLEWKMKNYRSSLPLAACVVLAGASVAALGKAPAPAPLKTQTMADVLAASKASDWHALDPANTLYLELASGRVVIELAPAFAPQHAANIKALAREKYFDGLAFLRSQDNYVVQWAIRTARIRQSSVPSAPPLAR